MKPLLLCAAAMVLESSGGGHAELATGLPLSQACSQQGKYKVSRVEEGRLQAAVPTLAPLRSTGGSPGSYYNRVRSPADGGIAVDLLCDVKPV